MRASSLGLGGPSAGLIGPSLGEKGSSQALYVQEGPLHLNTNARYRGSATGGDGGTRPQGRNRVVVRYGISVPFFRHRRRHIQFFCES